MSLVDQITRLFSRNRTPAPATTSTAAPFPTGRGAAARGLGGLDELRAARDRRSLVRLSREMYDTDTRGEQVISSLARDMVRGGFDVEVTMDSAGADEALQVVQDLRNRLDLDQRLDDWTRYTLRDGDAFLELTVDENLDIVEATRKPTLEVRRNSDRYDRFPDPTRAFWMAEEWATEPPPDAVWFAEWQMIHARWRHDEGQRYGRPLFGAAERPFKRMVAGETDMAVRRKTRAGQKYVHKFPEGTDPSVIEEYKALNRDALENPMAAIADFFGTVDVHTVQGDTQLGQVDDVMHHIRTWFLASPMPMSLLGYGQDLNRDVLEKQELQYQRSLEGLAAWPTAELVKPLIERQWLLKGIWPAGLGYRIKWRAKAPLTAAAVEQAANAGLKLRAVGAPSEAVRAVLEQLLPGVDLGEWAPATAGVGEPPAPTGTRETRARAGRLAQAASELRGVLP